MNNRMMAALIIVVAVLLLASSYMQSQRAGQLNDELRVLNTEVERLQQELTILQDDVLRIEKTSVSGMVENANRALVDGWAAMLESVERELGKAKERARQSQPRSDDKTD